MSVGHAAAEVTPRLVGWWMAGCAGTVPARPLRSQVMTEKALKTKKGLPFEVFCILTELGQ